MQLKLNTYPALLLLITTSTLILQLGNQSSMGYRKDHAKENIDVPDNLLGKRKEARGKGNLMIRGLKRLHRNGITDVYGSITR